MDAMLHDLELDVRWLIFVMENPDGYVKHPTGVDEGTNDRSGT
jgi:hypothetical protein